MKSIFIAALAAVLSLAIAGCGVTQPDRAASADQAFGSAKMGLVVATGLVSVYNLLPVCADNGPAPPLCYSPAVGDIINAGLAAVADAIQSSEKIFAAANSDPGAKLNAAKAALAAVQELVATLAKYGVSRAAAA
jgi:hypothetical protein